MQQQQQQQSFPPQGQQQQQPRPPGFTQQQKQKQKQSPPGFTASKKSTSSAAASVPAKQVLPAEKMPVELPYGGDLNAAMKARDREAIRQLMRVRDEVCINTKQQIAKRSSN